MVPGTFLAGIRTAMVLIIGTILIKTFGPYSFLCDVPFMYFEKPCQITLQLNGLIF